MQGRFKFRCYHKIYKKIYDVYSITPFGVVISSLAVSNKKTNFEDCILMQCTGLKDKNGKLIFEGDIVYNSIVQSNYIVVFLDGKFRLKSTISNSYLKADKRFDEIIGNIYENPELLNKEEL